MGPQRGQEQEQAVERRVPGENREACEHADRPRAPAGERLPVAASMQVDASTVAKYQTPRLHRTMSQKPVPARNAARSQRLCSGVLPSAAKSPARRRSQARAQSRAKRRATLGLRWRAAKGSSTSAGRGGKGT